MSTENRKLNPLVFSVLVIYPLLLIALGTWYISTYGISSFEIILFICTYYAANISIGVGLHRCWSHGAYKLNKYVEFIFAMISAGTLQGPALVWCSDHYNHHTYTDEEGDPHTPAKYGGGLRGFFWAHIGWMLFSDGKYHVGKITMVKLGRNKILRWQMKYYWHIAIFMNAVLPPILGFLIGGTVHAAIAAFIFMGLARMLQQQMTFCVNSLCHFVGSRTYYDGTARDISWMFIFLLGENWHNFHHAFAMDYRNGVKWYHLDIHKWIIYGLSKLGLATDLIRTSDVRIKAKIEETKRLTQASIKTKLSLVEEAANFIAKAAEERLSQAESSAEAIAKKLRDQIVTLQIKANAIAEHAREVMSSSDVLSRNIAKKYTKQLDKLKHLAKELNLSLPEYSL